MTDPRAVAHDKNVQQEMVRGGGKIAADAQPAPQADEKPALKRRVDRWIEIYQQARAKFDEQKVAASRGTIARRRYPASRTTVRAAVRY